MIGKAIAAVFDASIALGVLMPLMEKNVHAVVSGPPLAATGQQATARIAKNVFDCLIIFHRDSNIASNTDSDARLTPTGSTNSDGTALGVEHSTTVHVALDELERSGLILRLAIDPGRRNGSANSGLVLMTR